MKTIEREFLPVLLASDINTYSLARTFHEEYSVKSIVIGKTGGGPSANSKIIDFRTHPHLDEEETFEKVISAVSKEFNDKTIFLIGCGDSYVRLIGKNKDQLPKNVIAPYVDFQKMETLMNKEKFYALCDKYDLPYPKTFIYRKSMGQDYNLQFGFPVIIKPTNGVEYWDHPFRDQKKVYKADNQNELEKIIKGIYGSGYAGNLILQDFVPGDDTYMRVLTCYSDKTGKVKLAALGHVLLEEHTPHGLGNHAVIINEDNEKLVAKLRAFLDSIGYVGFSNFDIKYDERDNTFKVFEVNVRQGRSNYYVTGAGANLAKYLVEDYLLNKKLDLTSVKNKTLFLVVPQKVAFDYVRSPSLRAEMRALITAGRAVNPLFYPGDYGFKRLGYLARNQLSHFVKFRRYYRGAGANL